VPNEDEPESLQVWQECVFAVNNVIATEHHGRRTGILERPMERKTLQIVRVSNAGEHDMGDARVDEVEVGEVFDGYGLEGAVPGVVSLEVGAEDEVTQGGFVLVEDCAYFTHVGEAVVVFRS